MRFIPYNGPLKGLTTSEDYLHFKWVEPDCEILASVTRQGKGARSHFTSDKKGLRKLKLAVKEWCEFCFWAFPWCTMIIATIIKPSVERLIYNCGFQYVGRTEKNISVYIKERENGT